MQTLTFAFVSLTFLLSLVASLAEPLEPFPDSSEFQEWQDLKEFKEFQAWKKSHRGIRDEQIDEETSKKNKNHFKKALKINDNDETDRFGRMHGSENWLQNKRHKWVKRNKLERLSDPPPIDQAAMMARYIVNQADWTSVATISSRKDIESYPFVNVISFSDGPLGNGAGTPYLYLTPLDFTAQDVFKDNRATLMMTLAQGQYCATKDYDPMDPRCGRVVLTGKIKAIKEDNPEFLAAKNAVFGRHPWLAHMPPDHQFFFAKLKIGTIAVLDTFGGPKYVTVKDYMHPPNSTAYNEFMNHYHTADDSSRHPLATSF